MSPKNRSVNFFTTIAKNIEWVCTKKYDKLFADARSQGQQMGEELYGTEVKRMLRNKAKKWIRKWKGIIKYHDQVSFINNETLHSGWLIDCCNQLTSSHGK